MFTKKVASKKLHKTVKSSKKSYLNKHLDLKYFWPIFAGLFFLFLLSVFNLLSLWQIRQEMNNNLVELKTNINLNQDVFKLKAVKDEKDLLFNTSTVVVDNNTITTTTILIAPLPDLRVEVPVMKEIMASSSVATVNGDNPDIEIPVISLNDSEPPVSEHLFSGRLSSISDIFSGLTNIDKSATDMFWDYNMTAFVFPPVYELNKQSNCSTPDCGLSRAMTDVQSSCLDGGCLSKLSDDKLSFGGKDLQLPPVFKDKKIKNINIFSLDNQWLIGIVTGSNIDEQGWVYCFDGLSFSPLISNETEYQMKPRYQRGNGEIFFGGDAQDFLVLYAGYDAVAYRFRERKIEDVSKYFGLRVSDGGFKAQILKIGEGQSSIYYVCSLDKYKAKIVKIWSKDALNSGGAFDFSTIFSAASFKPQSILCGVSDAQEKKLLISAKIGNSYELWNFQDKGFDNSGSRQITSVNLKSNSQKLVKAAVISSLGIESKSGCPGSSVGVYLANEKENFNNVNPYLWHGFSKLAPELYWRFVFQPEEDSFYSPWFSDVGRLSYLSPEE